MIRPEKNPLEWGVFVAGLALSLGTMGILAWDAATNGDKPPVLSVVLGSARAVGSGYEVPVTVRNTGGETAEAVRVEVVGTDGRRAELEFEFVPRGSSREGTVFIPNDPTREAVSARVVSFRKP